MNNYYVKLKNGRWFVVVDDFLIGEFDAIKLSDYDDELRYKDDNYSFLDIAEVRDCDVVISGIRNKKDFIHNKLLWESSSLVEDFKKMHRTMWNDIADGKVSSKEKWIELFYSNYITHNCFANKRRQKKRWKPF